MLKNKPEQELKKVVLFDRTIAASKTEQIIKFLDQGADINSCDKNNKSILWWAAFNGNVQLVQILLQRKVDLKIANLQGQTPLDIATILALSGHRELDENNTHAEIVNLLKAAQPQPMPSYDDMDNLSDKIAKFGIHAVKLPLLQSTESQEQNQNSCYIL